MSSSLDSHKIALVKSGRAQVFSDVSAKVFYPQHLDSESVRAVSLPYGVSKR